ncbi:hypothetical protein D9758_018775 [Tetrapyrgos nigripes]|uniref:Uncharacterized protein n=1 Tax=Tetrapyrgos nigripes TaxID=182062 RepID=A0A8H5EZ13_9AGAR|nr:hypothetical protein D9758_018775 [Tetrapyrgos nigripes]
MLCAFLERNLTDTSVSGPYIHRQPRPSSSASFYDGLRNNRSDLDVGAMATTVLNPPEEPVAIPERPDMVQEISRHILLAAIRGAMPEGPVPPNHDRDNWGEILWESVMIPDEQGFLHPFGDPKTVNMATTRAFGQASALKDHVVQTQEKLATLPGSNVATTLTTLADIEDTIRHVEASLGGIKQAKEVECIAEVLDECRLCLRLLKIDVEKWRKEYPDMSPERISNGIVL